MKQDYELVLSREAMEFYVRARRSEKALLSKWFDSLAARPHQPGTSWRQSPRGIRYQVAWMGRLEVTWWVDDPVKEVRIIRIERV